MSGWTVQVSEQFLKSVLAEENENTKALNTKPRADLEPFIDRSKNVREVFEIIKSLTSGTTNISEVLRYAGNSENGKPVCYFLCGEFLVSFRVQDQKQQILEAFSLERLNFLEAATTKIRYRFGKKFL